MFIEKFTYRLAGSAALVIGMLWMGGCAAQKAAPPAVPAPAPAPDPQRHFQTADAGVKALTAAIKKSDAAALKEIFGAKGVDVVESGDAAADQAKRSAFLKAAKARTKVVPVGDDRAVLLLGKNNWPFPVPLLKEASGWRFDTEAGRREILERRIGKNELSTMAVLHAYVRAQKEYGLADRNHDGVPEYAQKLISTPGKRDGLYWAASHEKGRSPVGPLFARAAAKGGAGQAELPAPFHGYYYKILTAQGAGAPGGAQDYLVKGRLMLGYAMVAFPATYGSSGVLTFIINQSGKVYQKDLGPDTAKLAEAMTAYDPGAGWQVVTE